VVRRKGAKVRRLHIVVKSVCHATARRAVLATALRIDQMRLLENCSPSAK
jgi:hypothetical protein